MLPSAHSLSSFNVDIVVFVESKDDDTDNNNNDGNNGVCGFSKS